MRLWLAALLLVGLVVCTAGQTTDAAAEAEATPAGEAGAESEGTAKPEDPGSNSESEKGGSEIEPSSEPKKKDDNSGASTALISLVTMATALFAMAL